MVSLGRIDLLAFTCLFLVNLAMRASAQSNSLSEDAAPEHVIHDERPPPPLNPSDENSVDESQPFVPDGVTGSPSVVEYRFGGGKNSINSGQSQAKSAHSILNSTSLLLNITLGLTALFCYELWI